MVASSSEKTFSITWLMQFVEKFVFHPHMQVNKLTVLMCTPHCDSLHMLAINIGSCILKIPCEILDLHTEHSIQLIVDHPSLVSYL